jgi:hypothetical protein
MKEFSTDIEFSTCSDILRFKACLLNNDEIPLEQAIQMPTAFKSLSMGALSHLSLAYAIQQLNLSSEELKSLLEPISLQFTNLNIELWANEFVEILKKQYDKNGNLKKPELYVNFCRNKDDFIALGHLALEQIKLHGAFSDADWQVKNWGCMGRPKVYSIDDLKITIKSKHGEPKSVLIKWLALNKIQSNIL